MTRVLTSSGTATVDLSLVGQVLTDLPALTPQEITSSGNTLNIDLSFGQYIILFLASNLTIINISNWTTGYFAKSMFEVRNQGNFSITGTAWNAKFPGGIKPVITQGNGSIDLIILSTADAGITKLGFIGGLNCF